MQPDRSVADDLCGLIDSSPSPYHAVGTAAAQLTSAGFREIGLDDAFPAAPGAWFVTRGGSLVAWRQDGTPSAVRLVGAHTDSPNLRIKPQPDHTSAGVRQLGVEIYGGVLLSSWLDRELGISGRVAVRGGGGPQTRLLLVDEPVLLIPELAIHLNREVVTDGLKLNAQTHLAPMWDLDGDDDPASFTSWVAERLGTAVEDILSWDLMVHDLVPSRRTGLDGVFLSAPRLDNLCSSFSACRALAAMDHAGPTVAAICLYDHEEIGSTTATGAASAFLSSVLERIHLAHGIDRDGFHAAMARSVCLSADMAHATHPNYADKHEPQHTIALNGGPVVKVNANQRYATDAESAAIFVQAATEAGIPTQRFVMRNDLPCGSTIGPITSAQLGIRTVDIGVAQLAMHASREVCGADDPSWYAASMAAFLAG